jgi:thymidylate synthase
MTYNMDDMWLRTYRHVVHFGRVVSPRGMKIREIDHHGIYVDMNYPVLTLPGRKLNYKFMAAEALWILEGSDRVADLAPYNPAMARFSDDGVTLAGAYGPRFVAQLSYVLAKLKEDRDTRQATLTLWTPNPTQSKDIPCTVAMDFKIRDDRLNLHVFMRSSDVWLGLPYDVFSFTMIACLVACHLNAAGPPVTPGTLYLTAASSHVYEAQWGAEVEATGCECLPLPEPYYAARPSSLLASLRVLRDSRRGDVIRWWER